MTKLDRIISDILLGPKWKRHLLGWIVYAIFFYLDEIGYTWNGGKTDWVGKTALFLSFMGLIYVVFFLYDNTFRKNKVVLFVAASALASIIFAGAQTYGYNNVFKIGSGMNFFLLFPSSLYTVVMVTAIKYAKAMFVWQRLEIEKQERQNELERNFLLAQLSPHFLFNTLNNLYGHAVQKSDALPDMMIRLSDLLRYTIYEANKPLVPLVDELAYILDYIKLEQMRLSAKSRVTFTLPELTDPSLQIAPLILISFIENAFKHSRHTIGHELYINGTIYLQSNILVMELENSFNPEVKQSGFIKSEGGIGLTNVQKRLQLFYPGKHYLQAEETNGIYRLKLELEL